MEPYTPTHEIAYCMGLIVGEGSFSSDRHQPSLAVKLHARDPQPLLDLRGVFGGRLYGPYYHGGRHSRLWLLRGCELVESLPYFERWLPKSHKREQFEAWCVQHTEYFLRLGYVSRFASNGGRSFGFLDLPQSGQ
jgi:hypothetical protein